MSSANINLKDHLFQISILLLVCIIVAFSYPYLQYGVDGGLVLAGKINYPDYQSPMIFYFLNSWTAIHQIAYFFIKFGFSVELSSKLLMFFSTFFFAFGAFLFSNSISRNSYISLIISILAIILGKNFGDTNYPSLIFSEHTYGMMSLALTTFSFGLLANNNLFAAYLFSFSLFAIHPIVGAWVIIIKSIYLFIPGIEKLSKKRIFKGIVCGAILTTISFLFFLISSIEKGFTDIQLLKVYLEVWDGHRAISPNLHYEYLLKTIVLIISLLFLIKIYSSLSFRRGYNHILILLISVTASTLIYLLYQLLPDIFPDSISRIMPARFIMLHSFLGWPVILSILYFFLESRLPKKKVFFVFLCFFILIFIQGYKKINVIKNNLLVSFQKEEDLKVVNFVKETDFDGYILVSSNISNFIFKKTQKPILLHTEAIDFLPYHPYLLDNFFEILKIVYDIESFNPPEKNNPSLPDNYIKKNFEGKKISEWSTIKNKYNVNFIIVPNNWDLKLDLVEKDDKFKLFKIL